MAFIVALTNVRNRFCILSSIIIDSDNTRVIFLTIVSSMLKVSLNDLVSYLDISSNTLIFSSKYEPMLNRIISTILIFSFWCLVNLSIVQ